MSCAPQESAKPAPVYRLQPSGFKRALELRALDNAAAPPPGPPMQLQPPPPDPPPAAKDGSPPAEADAAGDDGGGSEMARRADSAPLPAGAASLAVRRAAPRQQYRPDESLTGVTRHAEQVLDSIMVGKGVHLFHVRWHGLHPRADGGEAGGGGGAGGEEAVPAGGAEGSGSGGGAGGEEGPGAEAEVDEQGYLQVQDDE